MKNLLKLRIFRYLGVAVSIVAIELALFQVVYLLSHNYVAATIISFVMAVVLNWILGRKVVFGASHHHPAKEFIMVLVASVIGLGIQLTVVWFSVEVVKLYPLIGKMLSIGFSFFWNYWFRAAIIYKKHVAPVEEVQVAVSPRFGILRPVFLYMALTAIVTLVLLWRYPNNVAQANFYGEDGSVYLQNIMQHGWARAAITPFNGYSIIGLYVLCGAGWLLNLVFGDGLVTLPAMFAFVSVLFMAAVIALPYLLFRRTFGRMKTLLVVVLGALVPLPLSPHIVVGTIGNQKWVFMYLAFLLVLYRLVNRRQLGKWRVVVIDALVLLCAYTNSTAYALVPLLFVPHLLDWWRTRKQANIVRFVLKRLRTFEFASLVAMGVLLVPQLVMVVVRGIPKLPGYLDSPYQASKSIELFVNRTYDFGITHLVNGHMSDIAALLIFGALVYVGWKKLQGNEKIAFFVGLYAAGVASLLFVLNRHGVTDFFFNYQPSGSGPDQFFFVQTLIMGLPITLAIFGFARSLGTDRAKAGVLVVSFGLLIFSGLASNAIQGERWRNANVFAVYGGGTYVDQAIKSCREQTGPRVRVTLYPYDTGQFSLYADRHLVCDQLGKYQPDFTSFGLQPYNNDYLTIVKKGDFTQTFKVWQGKLDGLRVFLSTFDKASRSGTYVVVLYDKTCTTELRRAPVSTRLLDNTYYDAKFAPLANSAGQTYCFSVLPPQTKTFDPLAVQQTQSGSYADGTLTLSGSPSDKAIVFMPLFDQAR